MKKDQCLSLKKYHNWHFDWIHLIRFLILMPIEKTKNIPRSKKRNLIWIAIQLEFPLLVKSMFGLIFHSSILFIAIANHMWYCSHSSVWLATQKPFSNSSIIFFNGKTQMVTKRAHKQFHSHIKFEIFHLKR